MWDTLTDSPHPLGPPKIRRVAPVPASPGAAAASGVASHSGWGWEISGADGGITKKKWYFNWRKCWCYKVPIPIKLLNQPKMEEVWGIDSATLELNFWGTNNLMNQGQPGMIFTTRNGISLSYHQQNPDLTKKQGLFAHGETEIEHKKCTDMTHDHRIYGNKQGKTYDHSWITTSSRKSPIFPKGLPRCLRAPSAFHRSIRCSSGFCMFIPVSSGAGAVVCFFLQKNL